ncbi:MAG: sulfatase-like hydrolase/transferase [Candidatus Pedobacter colombiensis]|uniref:Sulfatase-like hydrolase/transferase n=1 Tax=Candidatus Pedobacter colombiensis TaxID=3121371 RepID=A0AAJ5W5E7_9SPHI|nr:alkaline phosphatase family protein [Pedobacter sp.]WEK17606.1 MAG: sulfatase-like hydrolase/transferase [Pedobacter sp.]
MLKSLLFFIRFFLFWLLFFFIDRLIFIFIYHQKLAAVSFKETAATFYYALPLDLSMTAYIAVIPLLSYIYWLLNGRKTVKLKWLSVYNTILILICSILSVVNFNIYREWGSKVNAKALGFAFSSPKEAMASSASSPLGLSISLLVLLAVLGLFLQRFVVSRKLTFTTSPIWTKILLCIALTGANFLLIRGGIGVSPITQSKSYFSKEQILNIAAVNTEWNLISSLLSAKMSRTNPYLYLGSKQADENIKALYSTLKDTTINILNTKRPNVVLVIIESFTADLTKTLGNEEGITPHFDTLINKGVLFTQIYSSGSRTDKGLIATLAGFPTLASGSIVRWPEKMQKLPGISQSLFKNGYSTSFYYGGESEFDNYKAFILSHDYHKLIDINNFESIGMRSRWGKFDEVVFQKQLSDLNKEKQPFFSTTLTLTNHEPFDLPGTSKFGKADNIANFKSTAYYTDSCINAFLTDAKKQPWYKNTLFVFVADHGHMLPKNIHDISTPQRYHIPLLFYGDVIKDEFKGRKLNNIGSQTDIAATLLAQLDIAAKQFEWSKNLLNPYSKPFAFFSWDNGMGFIDNQQCVTFDNIGKMILYNSNEKDIAQTSKTLDHAKAYLQNVYRQFIEL